MKQIELCGVARAFVQISENGPRSKKFGNPWFINWDTLSFVAPLDFFMFDWS